MSLNKKLGVLGVICLFFTLTITPTTQANTLSELNSKEVLTQIEISEFKSDGSIENKIFSLTKTEFNFLKNELLNSKTIEEQLVILKGYGLIPENVKTKDLENGMYKKALSLGLTEDNLPEKSSIKLPILLNFFKKVNVIYFVGVSLNIGLRFIIRIINLLPFINLPTLDFADVCGGLFGVTITTGIIANHTLITFPGIIGFIGFVGYRIKFPLLMHIYTGFSALTFGLGLGLHFKDWKSAMKNLNNNEKIMILILLGGTFISLLWLFVVTRKWIYADCS